jgi:CheY-like chemotaxis protein/anti-sigma regulatory factor (Ser/Thr protein kinase)
MDLEMLEFDLKHDLEMFARLMTFKTEEKGIKLILNTDDITHCNIITDPGRLRQLLTNLVANAVKFTHEGQIQINVALQKENETHGRLRIDIADTGIGIAADKIAMLFEPFTQADGSTTRTYGGTGLGLSIVKKLCEIMGGTISVKSTPGEGSTFRIDLPVKLTEGKIILVNETAASDDHNRWPESTRILVVDDNDVNLLVAQSYLKEFGVLVEVASSGAEAIKLLVDAKEQPYSLVLMDCLMPQMDGYETTSRIRLGHAAEANKKIPIIAMTANAMQGDREKCIDAGMDDYITKPVTRRALQAVLRKWI